MGIILMKKQIKDLTIDEFEKYILNTELGEQIQDRLKDVEEVDDPNGLYSFTQRLIKFLETEIIIDK